MNFLAHAYLSFYQPDILVGNLIADTVKGQQIELLPHNIRKGVAIHRQIDAFTDNHPVNKETKLLFRESAKRYDASFLDVAYDHFLAIDIKNKPEEGWENFAQYCYTEVEKRADVLPPVFSNIYVYMRSEDWLSNYHQKWMIERSFERLKRRASYLDENAPVFETFENHFDELQHSYDVFFSDLKTYAKELVQNADLV